MFYIIAAVASNGVIGLFDQLPWHEPAPEIHYFEKLTKNHTMIMSQKTYEAFGSKRYKARKTLLVSRKKLTLSAAMTQTQDEDEVFIMGGRSLFEQCLPVVSGLYLIRIPDRYPGDVHFPNIPQDLKLKYARNCFQDKRVQLCYFER